MPWHFLIVNGFGKWKRSFYFLSGVLHGYDFIQLPTTLYVSGFRPFLFTIYLFTQRKKYINLIKQINFVFISEAKVCFDNFLHESRIRIPIYFFMEPFCIKVPWKNKSNKIRNKGSSLYNSTITIYYVQLWVLYIWNIVWQNYYRRSAFRALSSLFYK